MDNTGMINFATISMIGILLRWSVSLFPYSGAGNPPIYGDYEAQRHWQEITVNLPIEDWYKNTTDNDLLYWGLDYPPLTAYHSYLCGFIAKKINPDYVSLHTSKGYESYEHKLFMRYTVLAVDVFLYFPAAYILTKYINIPFGSKDVLRSFSCFIALILYPGLYLIDHGHFQYNNASLGLFLMSVAAIYNNYDIISAIFFSLALNYKQMELYHALPFFFYILGKNFVRNKLFNFIWYIIKVGFAVIFSFLCCWSPFLTDRQLAQQVLQRIFPIGRGLYEDKVANFWCSINILIKLKTFYSNNTLALICLVITAIALVPTCSHLLYYPKPYVFLYSLINCSFIFFLFSFHVHEKSILLVAIPICLIYHKEPFIVRWFFITSVISMFPLLIRDNLTIPTLCLTFLSTYFPSQSRDTSQYSFSKNRFCQPFLRLSMFVLSILSILSITMSPPAKYPDLFPVLISLVSFAHYTLFCLYFHYCQYKEGIIEVKKRKLKYT